MTEKTWPAVAGTALVTLAFLLLGGAIVYLGASSLSGGVGDNEPSALLLSFVLPLIAAAGAVAGAVTLLTRARPKQWGRYIGLGVAIAFGLVLLYLFVLPELLYPDA